MTRRAILAVAIGAVLLVLLPAFTAAIGQPFYLAFATRVLIFAIAAVSLDLILGYGGLASFGHAAYLGLGGYAVGILASYGFSDGWLQLAAAVGFSGIASLLIGLISLRTSGVYFIMITLAFAQMLYFLGVSLKAYGGDDGLTIASRSRFPLLNLASPTQLYYVVLAVLAVVLVLGYRLIRARFGLTLRGIKSNERRMAALGFSTLRYRLTAFVIAGCVCGLAGFLLANLTQFISPATMHWTRSGELMVMVILGGMGSLFGPVLGAAALLGLEEVLSGWTQHWQLILGPILVAIVLFARRGLWGAIAGRDSHG